MTLCTWASFETPRKTRGSSGDEQLKNSALLDQIVLEDRHLELK
jgi:hypothetical protein